LLDGSDPGGDTAKLTWCIEAGKGGGFTGGVCQADVPEGEPADIDAPEQEENQEWQAECEFDENNAFSAMI
jgi:hypothetical protein